MTRRGALGTIVLLALAAGVAGWWLDDWRWAVTGAVGAVAALVLGACVAALVRRG